MGDRLARASRRRRQPWISCALAGISTLMAVTLYLTKARSRLLCWGATAEEQDRPMPGDELSGERYTQAITIAAPPEAVWPWLVQMGQGKAAFYSHAWVETFLGCRMRNAETIVPEWQNLAVGDWVRTYWDIPGVGPIGQRVKTIDAPHALVLEGARQAGWTFYLEELADGETRLFLRDYRMALPRWLLPLHLLAAEPLHLYQMTGMLQGLKARAERRPPVA